MKPEKLYTYVKYSKTWLNVVKRYAPKPPLEHLGVKISGQMMAALAEVQIKNGLITKSEAVRLVFVKGLRSLGIDLSDITDGVVSQ